MRAIVFDLDNTLYPYSPCDLAGRSAVFETLRGTVEISRERFESLYAECDRFTKKAHPKTAAGHNRLLFCHHLCEVLNLPADIYDIPLYDAYWNAYLNAMQLFPGAKEMLLQLQCVQIPLGICSDLTLHIQLRKLQRLGLTGVFQKIVTSEECGEEKPSPKMFQDILQKLGASPKEAVMIGDNYQRDILGAMRFGMRAILFGEKRPEVPSAMNFAELRTLLESPEFGVSFAHQ